MQLHFNFDLTNGFQVDNKVFLVHNIIEEMNLNFLKNAYQNIGRKPVVEPKNMLKILVFAYINRKYSSRDIEDACKYDLRFIWLLNNRKAPDHVTINRFRNKIYPFIDEVLNQLVEVLIQLGEVDLKSIYVDGTKIEANANKYTFVWKKSILKYQESLKEKIRKYFNLEERVSISDIKKIVSSSFNKIRNICKVNKIIFIHGSGRRKTIEQKEYELLEEWLYKLVTYEKHLKIMGERNSYSKTDNDATFMRMKEDHMRNGQLKPAYNIQCATNGGYVIGVESFPNPSDITTLIPFLEKINNSYDVNIKRVVADYGYESEENYKYLEKNSIESFIKPQNYQQKKKRKYKMIFLKKT